MSFSGKKIGVLVLIIIIIATTFEYVPKAHSELSEPEKALAFMRDVVGLDLNRYNVTCEGITASPTNLGAPKMDNLKYRLECPGSKFDVLINFVNGNLCSYKPFVDEGSPFYAKQFNSLQAAKNFMQTYSLYSQAVYLPSMKSILDSINELNSFTTTTFENVKFELSSDSYNAEFNWFYTSKGFDVPALTLLLDYTNNSLVFFVDNYQRYSLGTTDVNLQKEQAVEVANQAIQNYSYTFGSQTVSNFTILDQYAEASLQTAVRDKSTNLLYPEWFILLPLDRVYPGGITCFQVLVWADTGEVFGIVPTGPLGEPLPTDTAQPSPSPSQTATPFPSPSLTVEPTQTIEPTLTTEPTPSQTIPPTQEPTTSPNQNQPTAQEVHYAIALLALALIIAAVALLLRKKRQRIAAST